MIDGLNPGAELDICLITYGQEKDIETQSNGVKVSPEQIDSDHNKVMMNTFFNFKWKEKNRDNKNSWRAQTKWNKES